MSPVVFPSPLPGASSDSLLATAASTALAFGSQTSVTCHADCTGTIRWFGGHRVVGLSVKVRDGGIVSCTTTDEAHVAWFPVASVEVKATPVVPSG